jgi:hypothetical protein
MNVSSQRRALATRDAHAALRNLKTLVDFATEKLHVAELETVDAAIGRRQPSEPLRTLLGAADALRSAKFNAALEEARLKMETAVASHQAATGTANSE